MRHERKHKRAHTAGLMCIKSYSRWGTCKVMYPHTHSHWLYYYLTYRNRKSYILRVYLKNYLELQKEKYWRILYETPVLLTPGLTKRGRTLIWLRWHQLSFGGHECILLELWQAFQAMAKAGSGEDWDLNRKGKQRGKRLFSKHKQPLNLIFLFCLTQGWGDFQQPVCLLLGDKESKPCLWLLSIQLHLTEDFCVPGKEIVKKKIKQNRSAEAAF